ncbi:IS630 family transposase [Planctomicrobium sp. SH527]|uniref:IS630 family transposase n=1 Tax=Planctomicrobium sp. SH527 TaxID=3448123 RepID=UPI003F5BFE8C
MSNALSVDLRRRILEAIDQGVSQSQVARTYRVDRKTVWSLIHHRQKTGSLEPIRAGVGRKSKVAHRQADIRQAIADNSSLTLQSLIDQLGLAISVSALSRTLRRWGIRLKKSSHASEQQRPDVKEKRRWWGILVRPKPQQRLIFLDETGANTKMARLYGWGNKSERVRSQVPHGHWKTITFIAALRCTGVTAPMVLDGPMNRESFLAYIQQCLVPTLNRKEIVVLDNLPCHKQPEVIQAIEAVGASVFYLPPYSPDFNPIEKAFSKLKALLRKFAERTIENLWKRIGALIETFTPNECRNYFLSCGYRGS